MPNVENVGNPGISEIFIVCLDRMYSVFSKNEDATKNKGLTWERRH